ncbi:MAG: DUF2800 domain-containing protein [Bacteroidaceae bacterium]|nr:DUF2800 domain-containing protein [Bacteroidaceae bacterium]
MGAHALLSPSSASRWLNCTAAPHLEANMPDVSSDFAVEGTLAHAYCAKKLKTFLGLPTELEDKEIAELSDYYTGEMNEYTDTYASIVIEKYNAALALTPDAQLLVETRLDFSEHIPYSFGTADAIIIADGTMEVIDFKYGKGVKVSAVGNPQMQIYALGAYDKFNFEYRIERVRMTIVQPRIDNLSEYEITALDLLRWTKDTLTPKAQEAFSGKGTQNPGEWCRFCKVKCRCRALSEQSLNTALSESNPQLLAPDELADILPKLDTIKLWIAGIEDYALHTALSGTIIPGWKVVEGRSTRKITNPSAVSDALTSAGIARDTIYKPQELLAITELERLVGRKQFAALCAQWISKPQGKPTLVPNTDKRQAINTVEDDFADIH